MKIEIGNVRLIIILIIVFMSALRRAVCNELCSEWRDGLVNGRLADPL